MPEDEVRLIKIDDAIQAIQERACRGNGNKEYICQKGTCAYCGIMEIMNDIESLPTIKPEVRHGRWIECDYKHMEHGMIETEPKAGLCCSECRTAFQKKKMTYKQYCAACGALMDGGNENVDCAEV